MKIFNLKVFSAASAILIAALCCRADLVWTKEKGWQIEGGVLASVFGESGKAENALAAMNEAKRAQEAGDLWDALGFYKIVVQEYPESIFAPEAYYQMGLIYMHEGMFTDSYQSFESVLKNYPEYPKFNMIIGQEYKLATVIEGGATPYLWGWLPWFTDYNEAIKIFESVVVAAPYSDYAPMSLMNIALTSEKAGKPELAIDALDRLINTYPQSMFTPDAYMQMARTYRNMVEGPEYDQASVIRAMDFYQDFMILFPRDASIANAESGFELMQDTHARSRLIMGDFYYYYRNNNKAASIFYNETITIAPSSLAATEARNMLKEIADGAIAPMTPVDWFFGRYERPDLDAYVDETKLTKIDAESFEIKSAEMFLETPGVEASETFDSAGNLVNEQESFMPIVGPQFQNAIDGEGLFGE